MAETYDAADFTCTPLDLSTAVPVEAWYSDGVDTIHIVFDDLQVPAEPTGQGFADIDWDSTGLFRLTFHTGGDDEVG